MYLCGYTEAFEEEIEESSLKLAGVLFFEEDCIYFATELFVPLPHLLVENRQDQVL